MNTPNPLVPKGSLLEEHKSRSKSNLFVAVFTILSIHVVLFTGLLMQGCKKDLAGGGTVTKTPTNNPAVEVTQNLPTNTPVVTPPTNEQFVLPPVTNVAPVITPPTVTETSTPPAAVLGAKEYKAAPKDTFFKIAKDHGVTVTALRKANPKVDPKKLKPGTVLQIPEKAAAPEAAVPAGEASASATGKTTVYVVKPNENLTKIAKAHGVSVKAIKAANGMRTDGVKAGQKLKLPAAKEKSGTIESTKPTSSTPTSSGTPNN